jgi:hypothetical protein
LLLIPRFARKNQKINLLLIPRFARKNPSVSSITSLNVQKKSTLLDVPLLGWAHRGQFLSEICPEPKEKKNQFGRVNNFIFNTPVVYLGFANRTAYTIGKSSARKLPPINLLSLPGSFVFTRPILLSNRANKSRIYLMDTIRSRRVVHVIKSPGKDLIKRFEQLLRTDYRENLLCAARTRAYFFLNESLKAKSSVQEVVEANLIYLRSRIKEIKKTGPATNSTIKPLYNNFYLRVGEDNFYKFRPTVSPKGSQDEQQIPYNSPHGQQKPTNAEKEKEIVIGNSQSFPNIPVKRFVNRYWQIGAKKFNINYPVGEASIQRAAKNLFLEPPFDRIDPTFIYKLFGYAPSSFVLRFIIDDIKLYKIRYLFDYLLGGTLFGTNFPIKEQLFLTDKTHGKFGSFLNSSWKENSRYRIILPAESSFSLKKEKDRKDKLPEFSNYVLPLPAEPITAVSAQHPKGREKKEK